MNLTSVLNSSVPFGAALPQANTAEGGMDFGSLIENASAPGASGAIPKLDLNKANAVPDQSVQGKIAEMPLIATAGAAATAAVAAQVAPGAGALKGEADIQPSAPTTPIDAPPAVKDLALRTPVDAGKAAITQDMKKSEPAKPDTAGPKAMQDRAAIAVKPANLKDSEGAKEESTDADSAPSGAVIPLTVQPTPQPAAPTQPAVIQAAAFVQGENTDKNNAISLASTEGGKDKTQMATPELPNRVQSSEQPVTTFAMPSATTPVGSPAAAMTAPIFGTPDIFMTHQLDLARDTQWIDQLAREIVSVAGQDGKLRFGLSPNNLGHLEVTLETQQDGVNIQLQASTETAAKIFAAEQPKLFEELRQSGVRVTNSDLMGGQHMQGQRDQSRAQNPASQASAIPTANFAANRNSSSHPTTSRNGRFA